MGSMRNLIKLNLTVCLLFMGISCTTNLKNSDSLRAPNAVNTIGAAERKILTEAQFLELVQCKNAFFAFKSKRKIFLNFLTGSDEDYYVANISCDRSHLYDMEVMIEKNATQFNMYSKDNDFFFVQRPSEQLLVQLVKLVKDFEVKKEHEKSKRIANYLLYQANLSNYPTAFAAFKESLKTIGCWNCWSGTTTDIGSKNNTNALHAAFDNYNGYQQIVEQMDLPIIELIFKDLTSYINTPSSPFWKAIKNASRDDKNILYSRLPKVAQRCYNSGVLYEGCDSGARRLCGMFFHTFPQRQDIKAIVQGCGESPTPATANNIKRIEEYYFEQ